MNELQNFNFSGQDVRIISINDEPWFVVADIAKVINASNPSMLIDMVDDEDRAKQSLGRQGKGWGVNESGLYTILLRSNNPQAKPFRRWVTSEVLPTIRKRGAYMTDQKANDVLNGNGLADLLIQAGEQIKSLESENSQLSEQKSIAEQRVNELQPKASYGELVIKIII